MRRRRAAGGGRSTPSQILYDSNISHFEYLSKLFLYWVDLASLANNVCVRP